MISALRARLGQRPMALAPRALDGLLGSALPPDARALLPGGGPEPDGAGYELTENGIAIVPVLGPLLTRGDWLTALLGASDYGSLGDAIEAAFADSAARAVLLEFDSPGGEVGGLFDLIDRIGALRAATGKPLWAVASESALSAAYAIASTAERLYLTRTAEVGSVGVVAAHIDESAADAIAGRKWTLVHAGARKVDGNSHEALSGTALAEIQADVDALYAELVTLVAENRGMSPSVVRDSEAAIYRGKRGITAGFADRLGTLEQALSELASALDPPPARAAARPVRTLQLKGTAMSKEDNPTAPADPALMPPDQALESAQPEPAEPTAAPGLADETREPLRESSAPANQPAEEPAERLRAEYAEIAAIAAQAGRLGVTIDAADAMRKGIAPHALRHSVLNTLSQRAEASAVVPAAPHPVGSAPEPGESPLVRRARERAAATRS